MKIRIIQWNISSKSHPEKITQFLSKNILPDITIICLQEVLQKTYDSLLTTLEPDGYEYSLNLRVPGKNEGRNRRLGVALLSFGATIESVKLLERSVFPERSLYGVFKSSELMIKVLSFHSLTGVDYKKAKSSNFASIADFMEENKKLDFACFDANEPKIDSNTPEKIVFWDNRDKGINAGLIMGKNKVHLLSDSYSEFLKKIKSYNINEPLAISHITNGKPRRYDHIFASKKWKVNSVVYPHKASLEASSDHSAVIADLKR